MFASLERLISPNRRSHPRLEKPFSIAYTLDSGATWTPAYGLNIGLGGVRVLVKKEFLTDEVTMRMSLDSSHCEIRVKPVWNIAGMYKGELAYQYGMQFAAASAADRELIERWLAGKPLEEVNHAQEELHSIRLKPDDVNRLIPLALQEKLLQKLVERGRLAPLDPTQTALVAYDYGGKVRYQGKPMHRLTIHSKVMGKEDADRYSTRMMFDETGVEIVVLDGNVISSKSGAENNGREPAPIRKR